MAEKGYGDFPIRSLLQGLDIPEVIIDESMKKISQELGEEERISRISSKRKGLEREKMVRFLAGRGFPYEKILHVLGGDDQ